MKRRNGLARALAAGVALSVVLAGCSGDDDGGNGDGAPTTTGTVTATTDETSAPTEAPTDGATDAGTESATDSETAEETEAGPDRDPVVELEGEAAGIRSDVTLDSCDLTAGAVQATGSVTNSADEARDVVVMIVWLEQESNSSLARKTFVERDLAPGESVDFTLDAELAEDARECVVNARAGTAAE